MTSLVKNRWKKSKKDWRNGTNGCMPENYNFQHHLYWTPAPKKGRYKKWDTVMTFISSGDNYKSGCKSSSACWTEFITGRGHCIAFWLWLRYVPLKKMLLHWNKSHISKQKSRNIIHLLRTKTQLNFTVFCLEYNADQFVLLLSRPIFCSLTQTECWWLVLNTMARFKALTNQQCFIYSFFMHSKSTCGRLAPDFKLGMV